MSPADLILELERIGPSLGQAAVQVSKLPGLLAVHSGPMSAELVAAAVLEQVEIETPVSIVADTGAVSASAVAESDSLRL